MFGLEGYRKSSHTTYQLHYHFVSICKYRKPALRGDVAVRLRDMIREIRAQRGIEILKGHLRPEHVHLSLSVPPHLSPSRVMELMKGQDVESSDAGVRGHAEGVLGPAPLGPGVRCGDDGERDGRGSSEVHRVAACLRTRIGSESASSTKRHQLYVYADFSGRPNPSPLGKGAARSVPYAREFQGHT
jgi:putative transposase